MTTSSINTGADAAKLLNDQGYSARPSLGSKASFMITWPKAPDSASNRAALAAADDLLEDLGIDAELATLAHNDITTTARYRIQGS